MDRLRLRLALWLLPVMVLALAPALPAAQVVPPEGMLRAYVDTPDATYSWERGPERRSAVARESDLLLTSQVWRGITWRHLVRVFKPAQVAHPGWMVLIISGGDGPARTGQPEHGDEFARRLVATAGVPVAVLYRVPNQPLFGNLYEDEIISYTFAQFMQTRDRTWPLLFPMVKSAVRAMDALQAYARQEWRRPVTSFVVTGCSKRGWTTWLTGAYDRGRRVKAIAPMVIDLLNMTKQFPHQVQMWGTHSEEISEYSSKGLTEILTTPQGRRLVTAVDPYTQRRLLTMPKLLVFGSNDPYWATDALNFYWADLLGPKSLMYCPNTGHEVESDAIGRVTATLGAFVTTVAQGQSMPTLSWSRAVKGDQVTLALLAPQATGARAWVVTADNLDFRPQKWEPMPLRPAPGGLFVAHLKRPADRNLAVFGEADFRRGGGTYHLSTQNIIAAK